MRFEFATAGRILFGAGVLKDALPSVAQLGRRALLVSGRTLDRSAAIVAAVDCVPFPVGGEPTVDLVREGVARAREAQCDMVIAVGGGSVIDAGKAVAALLGNPGDPLDYLEVIGKGQPLLHPSAPFVAIPTTAGTGSEATRNAVLASPAQRVKASLRAAGMLPRLAVVDPELTYDLPPAITASTGLDALTQLLEPFTSARANAFTDMICVEGMRRAAGALPRVYANPNDREARADMSFASLLGGMALANAGLGAVHGFAAPIGGMFPAPHGAVCAALLPYATEVNIRALRARAPESEALRRYEEAALLFDGSRDPVPFLRALVRDLGIPPLAAYGLTAADVPALVEKASQASSMKGNPIRLTEEELREIAVRAL